MLNYITVKMMATTGPIKFESTVFMNVVVVIVMVVVMVMVMMDG